MVARNRARGIGETLLWHCSVNLKNKLGWDRTILIQKLLILVISRCYVRRPKSTKSNHSYERWLQQNLGPTMVNK